MQTQTVHYEGPTFEELRAMYKEGHLDRFKDDLKEFIVANKKEILEYNKIEQKMFRKEVSLDITVRHFLFDQRSTNPLRDIKDQIEEILKYKWIEREHGSNKSDPEIEKEWTEKYAPIFREWRFKSVLYLYVQEKESYLDLLK